jgi:hypothetical protein
VIRQLGRTTIPSLKIPHLMVGNTCPSFTSGWTISIWRSDNNRTQTHRSQLKMARVTLAMGLIQLLRKTTTLPSGRMEGLIIPSKRKQQEQNA